MRWKTRGPLFPACVPQRSDRAGAVRIDQRVTASPSRPSENSRNDLAVALRCLVKSAEAWPSRGCKKLKKQSKEFLPHHPPAPASPLTGKRGRKNCVDWGSPPGPPSAAAPLNPATAARAAAAQSAPLNPDGARARYRPAGSGAWGCPPSILFFSPFPKILGKGVGGRGGARPSP